MRTTIDLPNPLFKQIKARAALQGRSLKDLMTEILQAELSNPLENRKLKTKKTIEIPIIRGECGPLMAFLTNSKIESLEDDDHVRS